MPGVRRVIRHIRGNGVAESADADPTQTAAMADRAQRVLRALQSVRDDLSNLSLRDILVAIHDLIPSDRDRASFRREMVNMRDSGERTPWLAIHEWVARGRESMDDDFKRD